MTSKILAVDDNDDALFALERLLTEQGYSVVTATDGAQALRIAAAEMPDLIILDINMPVMDGLETARRIKADPELKYCATVLLTSREELDDVLQGFEAGADDYIRKPFKREELLARVRAALRTRQIYRELNQAQRLNRELRQSAAELSSYSNIIGRSAAMREVFSLIERISESDIPVLILGESGTGKELVAAALHYNGLRREKAFVAQNCSAFGENLLESELFGHVRGAFTGAVRDKPGLFEVADGGTFFLDEVGDMPAAVQARLLRVLEDGSFMALGSTRAKKVDVRILAATNRDLRQMVEKGTFREDLYYRLNVVSLRLPALRERKEDLPDLISHFLRAAAARKSRAPRLLSREALRVLCDYHWPGNVRELRNEIERLDVLSSEGQEIEADLVSAHIRQSHEPAEACSAGTATAGSGGRGLNAAVEELERRMIEETLSRLEWNKSEAARELGISRSSLIAKVQTYGLKKS